MDFSQISTYGETTFISDKYFFETEFDLVDCFEQSINLKTFKNSFVAREFNAGFGIADTVIFEYSKKKLDKNLSLIDPEWAYTLRSLPYRKNFSIEDLCMLAGVSKRLSSLAINSFIEAGFCKRVGRDKYIKEFQPKSFIKNTIAVEAKLKNWKRALYQASRYKTFANQSWVLMDSYYSKPAVKNLDSFKRLSVGLASFSTSGELIKHYAPPKQTHYSELSFWRASTMLSQLLSDSFGSAKGL